jgi:hypothetical protein
MCYSMPLRRPSPSGRQKGHHFKHRRPATSVHGFALAVRRARARARAIMGLYHVGSGRCAGSMRVCNAMDEGGSESRPAG